MRAFTHLAVGADGVATTASTVAAMSGKDSSLSASISNKSVKDSSRSASSVSASSCDDLFVLWRLLRLKGGIVDAAADSSTVPMISLRLKGADDDAAAAGGGGAGGGGRGPLGLGRGSDAFRDGGTSRTSGGGGNGGGGNGGSASAGTGAAGEAAFAAALGAKGTGL